MAATANTNEKRRGGLMKVVDDRSVVKSYGAGRRTVVVGLKSVPESLKLLTWAMVKVAQPGDSVVALHVLDSISDDSSSLISLVKTFDSFLGVYEGFCSLKKVELKLKLCRGSPVKKILNREVKLYPASTLIVGTSENRCQLRSSLSVAKYCARKLGRNFSVIAVNDAKVVFQNGNLDQFKGNDNSDKRIDLGRKSSDRRTDVLASDHPPNCLVKSSSDSWKIYVNQVCASYEPAFPIPDNGRSKITAAPFDGESLCSSSIAYRNQNQNTCRDDEDHIALSLLHRETGTIAPISSLEIIPKHLLESLLKRSSTCRLFTYHELLLATSSFAPENLVGRGGSSRVYRGCLPDGKKLAVKILKPSKDMVKDFMQEIEIVTTLHHKNIISLNGFCFEEKNLLLVYDFLLRGSLEDNLHGTTTDSNLFGWHERFKVAVGVAEALNYLHNVCTDSVIHKDVKSSNILLSDDFESRLSDFGLSRRASSSSHVTCTDVTGTFGYLAPEYFMYGKVSDKVDVYAFGVVLLELLSGRKSINNEYAKGRESLLMWAKPILKIGKVSQLLDPNLVRDYNHDQIGRMILAATLCIRRAPRHRPRIGLILKLLQGDEEITSWARRQAVHPEEHEDSSEEELFPANIQSYLNTALLDLEDDSFSVSSGEQSVSLENYLRGRWSRSSSFD